MRHLRPFRPICAPRWKKPPSASTPFIRSSRCTAGSTPAVEGSLGQLDPAGRLGWRLRPRRQRALALVAADERHPGAGSRCAGDNRLYTARQRRRRHPSGHSGGGGHRRRRAGLPRWRRAGNRRDGIRYGRAFRGSPPLSALATSSSRWRSSRSTAMSASTGLLGPTETLVIADEAADPALAAADLLAQAEHDVLASAILLTPSPELARAVSRTKSSGSWRNCRAVRRFSAPCSSAAARSSPAT